jgi:hypothetical protein
VTQWRWDPETYLANMLAEVPAYEQLQDQTAAATEGAATGTILELGIGTGETAWRVGARHPVRRSSRSTPARRCSSGRALRSQAPTCAWGGSKIRYLMGRSTWLSRH